MRYYACIEFKPEKGKPKSTLVMKVRYAKRKEAKNFLELIFDPEIHNKCWIE